VRARTPTQNNRPFLPEASGKDPSGPQAQQPYSPHFRCADCPHASAHGPHAAHAAGIAICGAVLAYLYIGRMSGVLSWKLEPKIWSSKLGFFSFFLGAMAADSYRLEPAAGSCQ
jgi:hypothetical protein